MIGDRLGKWVIFKELGRGGMGQVYLAQEELTGRQAALKVLSAELAHETGFLYRFQREIDALSLLDHPGIVRFFESGCENGLYFYAMEYVEGQSLDEILMNQGPLPWQEVLDIATQICPALRHVHDHGIIHRDIKPPNIMRTQEGTIKLTDFGIAKVFDRQGLTAAGGVVGTAEFLSPEQAAGKPVSKRSDLYSLGIVLYTLLTGRTPFHGTSMLELLHKHRYAQYDPVRKIKPDVPYDFEEIVHQLLEKNPDDRPADCLVLAKQLERIRHKLEMKSAPTEFSGNLPERTVADGESKFEMEALAGPATLMSKLMRSELARQNRANPVARLLNRAWVLVPLLALCLGLIIWAFWPLDADTLYTRGAGLMASGRLADMREAWREYLGPLNLRYPDHPYQKEVTQFRHQLDAAEANVPTEAQRLYQRGERFRQEGDFKGAQRVWHDLITIFQDVDPVWVERAQRALADMDKNPPPDRLKALRPVLDRAAGLRDQGKRAEAEKIWSSLEGLYGHDAWAEPILKEVAEARKK